MDIESGGYFVPAVFVVTQPSLRGVADDVAIQKKYILQLRSYGLLRLARSDDTQMS